MKILKLALLVGIASLAGWALGFYAHRDPRALVENENETLRSSLATAQQLQQEAILERDSWRNRAEALEQSAGEVHRLRAEVSRLKAEQAAAQRLSKTAGPLAHEAPLPAQSATTTGIRKGVIPLENAPPAVAAAIASHVGNGRVKVAFDSTEDGKMIFGAKGQLPDGRAIAMRLAEDGSVLEKSTEIPAESVPAHIQDSVAEAFQRVALSGAREIIEGDRLMYELVSKSPHASMQITVRGDGAILAYNAKLKVPELKR